MFRVKRAGFNPWRSQFFRNPATGRPAPVSKPSFSTLVRTSIISRNADPKRHASTKPVSKPGNATGKSGTWKIVGGIGALCGGGLVGGALLYSYNEDFRDFANKSLPLIETFNLALGPASNSNENKEGDKQIPSSSAASDKSSPEGPMNLKMKESEVQRTRRDKQVASVSSVDQSAISVVDLDIATSVEEEAKQAKKTQATLPAKKGGAKQPSKDAQQKAEGAIVGSGSVASISALDQIPVSSLDLDIAKKAEKDAAVSNKKEEPKDVKIDAASSPEPDKSVDTSFTEQELTSIVDQTAAEVSIEQALSNLKQIGNEAMEAQKKAMEAVTKHVNQLRKSLVQSEEMGSLKDASDSLLKTQNMAQAEVITARSSLVKVNEEIEKLHTLIKQADAVGAKEASSVAAAEAARLSYDLQNAAAEVHKAKAESLILGEQEKGLQETKEAFRRELKEVMPELLTEQKEGADKDGDIRSEAVLLAYARKRVEQLERQISEQQHDEQRRLAHALKVQEEEDSKLMEHKIDQEVQKMSAEFNAALKKKESELAAEHETALRQQLRRQAAAYSDNLAEVLRIQAAELEHKYKEDLKEHIQAEREIFDAKLKGALGRLRGIEFAVESRAETEKQGKQAQEMWLACNSLNTAINDSRERPVPLMPHLTAIHDASPSDSVVTQVLGSVPEVAARRGVYSEEDLRSRFYKVRRACRRVAMVNEGNSGPWTYLLSYVQSFLVFDTFDPAKEGEMVDLDNVDTFELLARAEYYLRQGDLELAARFINQLCGESRRLSRDWLKEARLLLETRQAANFLTAYAAAAGMAGTN